MFNNKAVLLNDPVIKITIGIVELGTSVVYMKSFESAT